MPAVLNIGSTYFFFCSTANAAKVADLLHKATEVERNYKSRADTYRYPKEDNYRAVIEITMTNQKKPEPALKALPAKTIPNNEYHQK